MTAHETTRSRIRPADAAETIAEAGGLLRAGALVAFPTETVYGLGADAASEEAVARIFAAKERPRFNPLIVHVPDLEAATALARFDARARAVAEAFWPGPLTLVLPRRADSPVARLASAGLETLAIRVPANPVAQAVLRAAGRPIAAPSANASGRISPTTAQHVAASLGSRVSLIVDGGACAVGVESTVLDLTGESPVLLRPGGLSREALEARLGPIADRQGDESAPHSPGRLPSHYAPSLPLRLNATSVGLDEALLAFGPEPLEGAAVTRNLSPSGDLEEAAARLFACLHELDGEEVKQIAAMAIPERGLGVAINDRLRRAAAPRDSAVRKSG